MRRYYGQGYCYFITNVTFNRRPVIEGNYDLLREAVDSVKAKTVFDLVAWVFLPEHFHLMINPETGDFSTVMKHIKLSFAMRYLKRQGLKSGRVWQLRFWDRIIRDEDDFYRHLNYIHLNPVKHGMVRSPFDWPHSSIHKYRDFYQDDWGIAEEINIAGEFGE